MLRTDSPVVHAYPSHAKVKPIIPGYEDSRSGCGDSCSKDQRFTNSANTAAFCCITGLCYPEHFPRVLSNDRSQFTKLACVPSVSVQVHWESWNESEKIERWGGGFLFYPSPFSIFFVPTFSMNSHLKACCTGFWFTDFLPLWVVAHTLSSYGISLKISSSSVILSLFTNFTPCSETAR